MDNFYIETVGEGRAHFEGILKIVFMRSPAVTHYALDQDLGFILFAGKPPPAPYRFLVQPLQSAGAVWALPLLWTWLCEQAVYPPIREGTEARKGFRISTGKPWEAIAGLPEAVLALRPEWIHEVNADAKPQLALQPSTLAPLRAVAERK